MSLENKSLKVYSRGKPRRNLVNVGEERFGALLEADNEDLDSLIDGDNPLLQRPESSSANHLLSQKRLFIQIVTRTKLKTQS